MSTIRWLDGTYRCVRTPRIEWLKSAGGPVTVINNDAFAPDQATITKVAEKMPYNECCA